MRAAFEAFAKRHLMTTSRQHPDAYDHIVTEGAWLAWTTARAQALEEAKQIADSERTAFMEQASRNNGRESDFAFGSVNAAERIATAIDSLAGAATTKEQM